jgi:hypothetical protein
MVMQKVCSEISKVIYSLDSLSDYSESSEARKKIKGHIQNCEDCKKKQNEVNDVFFKVDKLLPLHRPSVHFKAEVQREIDFMSFELKKTIGFKNENIFEILKLKILVRFGYLKNLIYSVLFSN